MNRSRHPIAVVLALGLASGAGCIPGTGGVEPERLSISARDALREATTIAESWSPDARLKYIEGERVDPSGRVFPGAGYWRLAYEAPGRSEQLAVTITPRAVEQTTRPPRSPPGFVLGDETLGLDWIDSVEALEATRADGASELLDTEDATAAMLLVPTRPPRWVVRITADSETGRWRVDARTGRVLH